MAAATAASDQNEDSGFKKLEDSRRLTQEIGSGHDDDDRDGEGGEEGADTQYEENEDEEEEEEGEEEGDGDDDEDEEPRLKYARLTGSLSAIYRNGDATSCFLVTGDKMVCFCT